MLNLNQYLKNNHIFPHRDWAFPLLLRFPAYIFPEVIALGSRDGFYSNAAQTGAQDKAQSLSPRDILAATGAQLTAILFWHRNGIKPQSFN